MKRICALFGVLLTAAYLMGAPPVRISSAINSGETFVLAGHMRPLLSGSKDLGEANDSLKLAQLELHFKLSAAQSADLNSLLKLQQERGSTQFHKWLTPEQFGARFGAKKSDLNKVAGWLENAGFANVEVARSRMFVRMTGTAAQVKTQFGVAIHQYQRGSQQFYANASEPLMPKALEGVVSGLKGLTSYRARPFIKKRMVNPQITVGINGNHFLGPDDLATIYDLRTLYNQGTNGAGESIAVVGQSDINLSDIEAFQTAAGLPVKDPQIVLAGTDPGSDADNLSEADLDLEWAGAIARGANIIYVNSPNALDSATYAIENNLAPVVTISYGLCEAAVSAAETGIYNAAFQQANAQGITVIAASGDTGAAACDVDQDATGTPESAASFGLAVNFPASSPFVTAVGGTEFDEAQGTFWSSSGQATSYIPEIAWNDTSTWKVLSGSGGGASQLFTKPAWQAGTGIPADGQRDVPDIALSASPLHDPYLICSGGSCSDGFAPPVSRLYFVGGTSCAAPVFAGVMALLNQSTSGRQGNVNAGLYALASFTSGVFHDVELGDNIVPCVAGTPNCKGSFGFTAGPGYDLVTGLGSVDGAQLVEQWGSDFQLTLSPTALSLNSGSTASGSIQVTRFASFSGNVMLSCIVSSSLANNTTCSVPASVSGTGVATLTVVNSSTARFVPPWIVMFLVVGGLAISLCQRRRRLVVGFATLSLIAAVGCGSGSSVTLTSRSVTGNVTVTTTSGTLQHIVIVPVSVL